MIKNNHNIVNNFEIKKLCLNLNGGIIYDNPSS